MLLFRIMKRLLIILLLAILPLQATWAAVATCCQHEKEVAFRHVGHHEHQHEHGHEQVHSQEQQKDSSVKVHTDCLTCHGLAAAMIMPTVDATRVEASSLVSASPDSRLKSIPSSRPEKPQWMLAV